MAALMTFVNVGDNIMGLDLAHGGHLTHGSPVNFSGRLYNVISYKVDKDTGRVDFDNLMKLAKEHQPKLIICGGSAYPRFIEFEQFRQVADEVGAFLMADIAHPSGLVATGIHPSPMPYCDVVTTTTHKTLRGPRGGMIMMGKDPENPWGRVAPKSGRVKNISELIDSMVMPGIQGGPLMHTIASKAIAFGEALSDDYFHYMLQVKKNADVLAKELIKLGYKIVSGGTDNHMMLIDLRNKNVSGKEADAALGKADITVNKNMVPFDDKSPFVTSGIRIGTSAITTRGLVESDMIKIVKFIDRAISNFDNEEILAEVRDEVNEMMSKFPIFATKVEA